MSADSNVDEVITKRYLVSGKVQGVWFRASTQKEASKRGVTGFAKNLANGSVEVLMQGNAEALAPLLAWLHEGPALAKVTAVVEVDASNSPILESFDIY